MFQSCNDHSSLKETPSRYKDGQYHWFPTSRALRTPQWWASSLTMRKPTTGRRYTNCMSGTKTTIPLTWRKISRLSSTSGEDIQSMEHLRWCCGEGEQHQAPQHISLRTISDWQQYIDGKKASKMPLLPFWTERTSVSSFYQGTIESVLTSSIIVCCPLMKCATHSKLEPARTSSLLCPQDHQHHWWHLSPISNPPGLLH